MDKAILNDAHEVVVVKDLMEWAGWFEKANRHVAQDEFDGIRVSTVFLGMDHGYGEPLWFETMIFGGRHDGYQERYATWREAEIGHAEALRKVRLQ